MSDIRPSLEDLGSIMRARTADENGQELGTFTDVTRPTGVEADSMIDRALALATPRLGAIPDHLEGMAREIVCLRAAMFVENGYFQEQSAVEDSSYANFREQYAEALTDYDQAILTNVGDGHSRVASIPIRSVIYEES